MCTSGAEELNQGLPATNPAIRQGGTRTKGNQILSQATYH